MLFGVEASHVDKYAKCAFVSSDLIISGNGGVTIPLEVDASAFNAVLLLLLMELLLLSLLPALCFFCWCR